ncbi:MAG: hypothetical protein IJ493_07295 [Clostridia bacterium]|nr:hypothetical protein [Clostridia bacterium]
MASLPTDLMVVPERITPSGRVIAEGRLHGGLGFERMFDCFVYEGFDEDTLRRRFHRRPKAVENALFPVIDRSLTDKFRMNELIASRPLTLPPSDSPAVAVAIDGSGSMADGMEAWKFARGMGCFCPPDGGKSVSAQIHGFGC